MGLYVCWKTQVMVLCNPNLCMAQLEFRTETRVSSALLRPFLFQAYFSVLPLVPLGFTVAVMATIWLRSGETRRTSRKCQLGCNFAFLDILIISIQSTIYSTRLRVRWLLAARAAEGGLLLATELFELLPEGAYVWKQDPEKSVFFTCPLPVNLPTPVEIV